MEKVYASNGYGLGQVFFLLFFPFLSLDVSLFFL
jgi:hypothetical protein